MSQRGVCSIFFFAHILFCPGSPFASSNSFLICSDPSLSGSNLHSSAAVINCLSFEIYIFHGESQYVAEMIECS